MPRLVVASEEEDRPRIYTNKNTNKKEEKKVACSGSFPLLFVSLFV